MINKSRHIYSILKIVAIITLLYACNPTKKVKKGEYLLKKNIVINKDAKLEKSDIESYIKQKPNRKIFVVFRFHLWLYNRVNEDKVREKRILHDRKRGEKNAKRIAKGKKAKTSSRQLLGEWLMNIGEPPVIYDSTLSEKSTKQIKSFLNNKGYFISSVSDSVVYKKRKKANVYYKIKSSEPYVFNKLDYKISDEILKYYVFIDSSQTLIKSGNNYDVDVLQKERDRITDNLLNNGYFLFTKDYVYYEIDTNVGNRKVNVSLGIKSFAKKYNESSDSVVESNHQRFYINKIFIQPDFISKKADIAAKDTVVNDDYYFLYAKNKQPKHKSKVILNAIFIRKGLFQQSNVDDSYKRLAELKAFKNISISFNQVATDYLDCYIRLMPILKQSFTVETEGTNTSGSLGVSGSVVYQNRNLFKGAEVLELRIKGGIEAQPNNNQNTNQANNITGATQQFNTVEFTPELNVYVPRFLVPFKVNASKRSNPKTIFTSSYSFQRRPNFSRNISNISFGYTWKETATKTHIISPLVVNLVKVKLSNDFENHLTQNVRDLYILNSYRDHLTTSTKYTYIYNEQNIKKSTDFKFFRLNFESSGNILRSIYDVVNKIQPNTFAKDTFGRYNLFEIPFSQYLRSDIDFRYYLNKNEINKFAFRIAMGIGLPLVNFKSLPFERSFYSGGANGMRAWQARSLGPGSYSDDGQFTFDQLGDGQIEGNVEYRFKMFKMLHGALFVDAGNVWLQSKNSSRPGGEFQIDRFYKEIAIGSGIGVRGDFNFFIIRLDLGLKVRDPQFSETRRWVIGNLFNNEWKNNYALTRNGRKYSFFAFNIGIGYPF